MMSLENDRSVLQGLLDTHKAEPIEQASYGVRTLHHIYTMILEDAISTLDALINFLQAKDIQKVDTEVETRE